MIIGRSRNEFDVGRVLPEGEVTIRQACPQDVGMIQTYIRCLSSVSRHNRFLGALSEIPAVELHRMTQKGPGSYPALIAQHVIGGNRMMIGEARYAVAPDGLTCEFAVSVADAWQRKALGSLLIGDVSSRAKALGVHYLVGDVLRSNDAMIALARKLGFSVTESMGYPGLVKIKKDLSRLDAAPVSDVAARSWLSAA